MNLPELPASAYIAFATSLLTAIVLLLTKRWHGRFSADHVVGVQKVHQGTPPRIGGVAIVVGVVAGYAVAKPGSEGILEAMLLAGLPAFAFGLAEDLTKKVSVRARLLATMASGVVGWWLTGVSITSVDVPGIDLLLAMPLLSVAFTAFAVGGLANAVNIVDGFNGLASGFVVIAMTGVGLIAYSAGDGHLALASICMAAAFAAFWLVNWPWGKLFLGDGGSYFGGFALAWACVMLIERNTQISPFAAGLLCVHPVTEVLFSIYRRKMHGVHPGHPDRLHLHSLLMRRVVRPRLNDMYPDQPAVVRSLQNPVAGLFLATLSLPPMLVAFALSQHTLAAAIAAALFMVGYVAMYARMVRFHWCSPIEFLLVKPGARLATSGQR